MQLLVVFSIFFVSAFSPNSPMVSLINNNNDTIKTPSVSDVAGSEMYSEQLSAYIAGDTSIIKQGYITNDSNILKGFDFNDPAFHECSVLIASSNGITPEMFPGSSTGVVNYNPEIEYTYTVNGREYTSNVIMFGGVIGGRFSKMYRRYIERYPEGSFAKVYYDPAKPENAVLEPGENDADS